MITDTIYYHFHKPKIGCFSDSLVKRFFSYLFSHKDFRFICLSFLSLLALLLGCAITPRFTQASIKYSQFKTTKTYRQISQHQETGFGQILAVATSFTYPLEGRFTQGFGWYHPALDIAAPLGTPIYPIGTGRIEETNLYSRGYGHKVIINHGNNIYSLYAHLGKISVEEGEYVDSSISIGTIGLTGRTTGPHLHLEILKEGKPINPKTFLSSSD